ncbi:unknown [[Mannheimia] succiniciproducens MBEL55E]|uniref:Uncharacterized protein n=1 Tax=Mannheimia succiniciproducens (strain KCTC 0769BP / MBEL55E) TaxID=221988 RepID=Q65RF8_MANSM|nr:unknown [[Mannheimia] succiniciproducens MBEL55E]
MKFQTGSFYMGIEGGTSSSNNKSAVKNTALFIK